MGDERYATVVVIGAGQAGLSAAHHLQRRGFVGAADAASGARSFIVLDAETAAGGAWQHRWQSLTMSTVNGIFALPGSEAPAIDTAEPSREAVPRYFGEYERASGLPILRPVRVTAVESDGDQLIVRTDGVRWRTEAIVNATGTWTNPVLPTYPGSSEFLGRQLHTRDYASAREFAGLRVAVVGGGISAVQQLEEISRDATTFWYTRSEPRFIEGGFQPETTGRAVIEQVTADVEAGRPSRSVVSYTGLGWTPYAVAARERGVLVRRPMFTRIEPTGVREADGSLTEVDVILWATGFRPAIAHLDPLGLRNELGGIEMRRTRVAADPRVHMIGFGPSQSTVGANRAGREAVTDIVRMLDAREAAVA